MVLQLLLLGTLYKQIYSRITSGSTNCKIKNYSISIPYSPLFLMLMCSLFITTSLRYMLSIFIILEIYKPNSKNIIVIHDNKKTDIDRVFYFSTIVAIYSCLTQSLWDIFVILFLGLDLSKSEWLKKITPLK